MRLFRHSPEEVCTVISDLDQGFQCVCTARFEVAVERMD